MSRQEVTLMQQELSTSDSRYRLLKASLKGLVHGVSTLASEGLEEVSRVSQIYQNFLDRTTELLGKGHDPVFLESLGNISISNSSKGLVNFSFNSGLPELYSPELQHLTRLKEDLTNLLSNFLVFLSNLRNKLRLVIRQSRFKNYLRNVRIPELRERICDLETAIEIEEREQRMIQELRR